MLRISTEPRADWRKVVESQGLLFHSIDGEPYWDESAYYLFELAEIDQLETASAELDAICLEAVEHVIREGRLDEFGIPEPFHAFVARSWERDEHTIYGRFDVSFNGNGPPKLLEYNADTPTALLEASVIQWFWSKALLGNLGESDRSHFDQFNSIHERLIEAWKRVGRDLGRRITFAALSDSVEDVMTVSYLRDTAIQAALKTVPIAVKDIGWNAGRRGFTNLMEQPIEILFKLYPWEWMLNEPFGPAPSRWSHSLAGAALEDGPEQQGDPAGPVRAVPRLPVSASSRVRAVRNDVRLEADPLARRGQRRDRPGRPDGRRDRRRIRRRTSDLPGIPPAPRIPGAVSGRGKLDGQRLPVRDRHPRG